MSMLGYWASMISTSKLISKYHFQIFLHFRRNTPRKCYENTSWIWLPFIQRYHPRRRFVSPFFFPHTSVKHPDARLQNCKACSPINCWEGLLNWGPFLTLGWDKILTPTWLFTYQKYCFFGKGTFFRTYIVDVVLAKHILFGPIFGGWKRTQVLGEFAMCPVLAFYKFFNSAWRERIDSCRSKTTLD